MPHFENPERCLASVSLSSLIHPSYACLLLILVKTAWHVYRRLLKRETAPESRELKLGLNPRPCNIELCDLPCSSQHANRYV